MGGFLPTAGTAVGIDGCWNLELFFDFFQIVTFKGWHLDSFFNYFFGGQSLVLELNWKLLCTLVCCLLWIV